MLKKLPSLLILLFIAYNLSMHNSVIPMQKKESKVIVFDIGGVLLLTDSFTSFKKLGIKNTLWYAWEKKSCNSDAIRSKFFDVLKAIKPFNSQEKYTTKDEHGVLLPPLMLDWLTGTSGTVIKKEIKTFIQKNRHFFSSKEEAKLVKNLAYMVFDPSHFIESRKLNKPIVKLLPILAQLNYTILLCSNWDSESFEFCKKKFPEIFNHIHGYIISGDEKCLKPEPAIFKALIEKYTINPAEQKCIFIDDQKENRIAAQRFGFQTYHPDTLKKIMAS